MGLKVLVSNLLLLRDGDADSGSCMGDLWMYGFPLSRQNMGGSKG